MREILFRGKRTDNGEWVEGYYVKGSTRHCITMSLANYPRYDVIPETVGQYTGLMDRNGKKIFEGDILRYYEEIETRSRGKETLKGVYKVDYDYCGFSPLDCIACHHCEVIGNIHDNPELLEEVQR